MRFFEVVLSGAALIAAAWAVELNDVPTNIEPGKTYTITYSPKDNTPTTLKLRKGVSTNLDTLATLTTTATGGSFQWTVPNNLVNGNDYALEINQEGQAPNYSGQFSLSGSNAVASPSSGASSATSASPASTTISASVTGGYSTTVSASVTGGSTLATSASAGVSSSVGANSTIASPTLSRTSGSPSGTASTTGGSSPPQSTGAASMLGSSTVALIFGAVAAVYFN